MKYRTIVADPPWEIAKRMGSGGRRRRATEVPYSFMSLAEIMALPVGELAAPEAHLYLWSTRRLFREGITVAVTKGRRMPECRCVSGHHTCGLSNPEEELIVALARVEELEDAIWQIAAGPRPDGTYNLSREACQQVARKALRSSFFDEPDEADCGSCSCVVACEGRP